jgi:hypothetical protein
LPNNGAYSGANSAVVKAVLPLRVISLSVKRKACAWAGGSFSAMGKTRGCKVERGAGGWLKRWSIRPASSAAKAARGREKPRASKQDLARRRNFAGSLVRWFAGSLVRWFAGSLVHFTHHSPHHHNRKQSQKSARILAHRNWNFTFNE